MIYRNRERALTDEEKSIVKALLNVGRVLEFSLASSRFRDFGDARAAGNKKRNGASC